MKKSISPRIMIVQMDVESKNLKNNFQKMKSNIQKAIKKKADLIVFSEMCLTGYFNGDWWESSSNLRECEEYLGKLEALSKNIDILFGSVGIDWKQKNEDGRVRKYNAAFFAHKGKFLQNKKTKLSFWPKVLLPQYREFDDSRHFYDLRALAYEKNYRVEELYEPVSVKYHNQQYKIGISICEDVWDENYSISPTTLFSEAYKHSFFINLSASPFTFNKNVKRDVLLSNHARKMNVPLLYVNCVGSQNIGKTIFGFDGSSKVFSKTGELVEEGKYFEEDNIILNLDTKLTNNIEKIAPQQNSSFNYDAQLLLESTLKSLCKKWNIKHVVIGASGGIDSALTSVIFARVLGPKNTYLVNMPTQFNADLTKNAAQKLAQNLKCHYAVFPIEDFVERKRKSVDSTVFACGTEKKELKISSFNFENIQARERGAGVLAAIASALNAVFSCNANKSELTVGYGTLYGDLAGFVCPIADLWKEQVYSLAQHYNEFVFQKEIIPQEIFNFPPSAELSKEQDILQGKGDPIIYHYHDKLFATWIEHWDRKTDQDCIKAYKNNTIDELLNIPKGTTKKLFPTLTKFKNDLETWWNKFNGIGAIKRVQSPPIIAISRRAFGLDYRESI